MLSTSKWCIHAALVQNKKKKNNKGSTSSPAQADTYALLGVECSRFHGGDVSARYLGGLQPNLTLILQPRACG
jgi:ABC-type microcin C transport system permease subunit YejE